METTPYAILILAANPADSARLALDEEVRAIDQGLRRAERRDDFVLHQHWAVRPLEIQDALLRYKPRFVHFCGHGAAGLRLHGDHGDSTMADAEALADLFALFAEHVHCVVFNACDSASLAQAVAHHIDYATGMDGDIGDHAAIQFAAGFYQGIGDGQSVAFAYRLGCNAIDLAGERERPKLFLRPPPGDNDRAFLDAALERFQRTPALILLAQEHRVPRALLTELEADLRARFPAVCHLVPPAARRSSPQAYFGALAKRLDLAAGVDDDAALEDALWERLRDGTPLCLLISRLEKGDSERADEFAGVLRNLLEDPALHLHVLLCGGQKLAELRFAGVLSLLNNAALLEWPEYSVEDVQRLYQQFSLENPPQSPFFKGGGERFPPLEKGGKGGFSKGGEPEPAAARDLLARSGGHPVLLQRACEHAGRQACDLSREPALISAFARLDPRQAEQVRAWLEQDDLGVAPPYIFDALLRQVYWLNLLTVRGGRLVWRCEAVREAGRMVLNV